MALPSCNCVAGLYPNWKKLGPIVAAARTWAGEAPNLHCYDNRPIQDQLNALYCAVLTVVGGGGGGGGATLLASFYIPEIVDTFERGMAAGYTGSGDPESFQREAAIDVLRDAHYQSGGPFVLLEDDPTLCEIVMEAPTVVPGELEFDASYAAAAVTVSVQKYQYRIDAGGAVDNALNLTLTNIAASAGDHTLGIRAVSTSGVFGPWATSETFTVTGPAVNDYPSLILSQLPEHYYRFGEATGAILAVDETGNQDGTLNGTITLEEVGLLFNDPNTCYDFGGGNGDYVEVLIATDPTALTISVLGEWDGTLARSLICRTDASGSGVAFSHQLRVTAGGFPEASLFDEGAVATITVTSADAITPGQKYLFTISAQNGGTMELHVDGVSKGTPVAVNTMWTGGDRWAIGSETGGGFGAWNGKMDEPAIFLTKLSTPEILDQFNMAETQT